MRRPTFLALVDGGAHKDSSHVESSLSDFELSFALHFHINSSYSTYLKKKKHTHFFYCVTVSFLLIMSSTPAGRMVDGRFPVR